MSRSKKNKIRSYEWRLSSILAKRCKFWFIAFLTVTVFWLATIAGFFICEIQNHECKTTKEYSNKGEVINEGFNISDW